MKTASNLVLRLRHVELLLGVIAASCAGAAPERRSPEPGGEQIVELDTVEPPRDDSDAEPDGTTEAPVAAIELPELPRFALLTKLGEQLYLVGPPTVNPWPERPLKRLPLRRDDRYPSFPWSPIFEVATLPEAAPYRLVVPEAATCIGRATELLFAPAAWLENPSFQKIPDSPDMARGNLLLRVEGCPLEFRTGEWSSCERLALAGDGPDVSVRRIAKTDHLTGRQTRARLAKLSQRLTGRATAWIVSGEVSELMDLQLIQTFGQPPECCGAALSQSYIVQGEQIRETETFEGGAQLGLVDLDGVPHLVLQDCLHVVVLAIAESGVQRVFEAEWARPCCEG